MSAIKIRQGEIYPNAEAHARARGAGFACNLFDSIEFRVYDAAGTVIVNGTATGDARGRLVYAWQDGDTDIAPGRYRAKFVGIIGAEEQSMPTQGYLTLIVTPNP